MSELVIDGAATTLRPGGSGGPGASAGADVPGGSETGRPGASAGAGEARPAGWWQAWRARFGLAELHRGEDGGRGAPGSGRQDPAVLAGHHGWLLLVK